MCMCVCVKVNVHVTVCVPRLMRVYAHVNTRAGVCVHVCVSVSMANTHVFETTYACA